MNDPIILRQKIRQVLALAPNRRFSEPMILDGLKGLMPEPVQHKEFTEALLWNQAQGYADYRFNKDYERQEWFLTPEGKQKEGL